MGWSIWQLSGGQLGGVYTVLPLLDVLDRSACRGTERWVP